ncbi:MAG: transaldolase [Actinomycetes bacterium]
MRPLELLRQAGQSIWLDNITRGMLASGELERYIQELSVTGLTSNPSIFHKAFTQTTDYTAAIAAAQADSPEELFFELAIQDLQAAADLFADIHRDSNGVDGWVSLEVSPLLAYDCASTITAALAVHEQVARPNVFIKIPGTPEGLPAIEECIFQGVPINVTLLFSLEQYVACVQAYERGIARRIAQGKSADVASVASVFISRWDSAVADQVPQDLRGALALAVGQQIYRAYQGHRLSAGHQEILAAGGRVQRLLFASTSTKDPSAPDTLYIDNLVAPDTINTMPDATLQAFADHGNVPRILDPAGAQSAQILAKFAQIGVDVPQLGQELQVQGAQAFVQAWHDLMAVLATPA